jgi:fatty-acyl-CoA synthase
MVDDEGLGTWLARRRARSPQAIAIIFGDEEWTYAQLADRSGAIAGLMSARGIGAGDRVAYFGGNSPSFIATLFACASLGAVFVPVNTRLAGPEIVHVLTDCEARVLIRDEAATGAIDSAIAEWPNAHVVTLAELAQAANPVAAATPVKLDDPVVVIYTSGTTGRAKGAVLSHRNLTWVALNCIIDYDVVSADVALMISPLFHVASLGMGALPILMKGATIVLERGFEAGRALELIEKNHVTMLSGVPTTFEMMANHPQWEATDISSLSKLTCGGSPAPLHLIEALERRGLHFSQGYGMTEAAPSVSALSPDKSLDKLGSVGLAHFFTRFRIVDKRGREVGPTVIGEIEVTGPNVFSGYLGLPEANAVAFTEDGWFKTGDLGYVDDEGFLFIEGRVKDLIISGGENIYPVEVEALIEQLPAVEAVAVVGVADARWGEVPWAVVTLGEGAQLELEELQESLRDRVAKYKIPKGLVIVDELPRTATGKIKKQALRKRLAEGTL